VTDYDYEVTDEPEYVAEDVKVIRTTSELLSTPGGEDEGWEVLTRNAIARNEEALQVRERIMESARVMARMGVRPTWTEALNMTHLDRCAYAEAVEEVWHRRTVERAEIEAQFGGRRAS
jgi:hypothetical protein